MKTDLVQIHHSAYQQDIPYWVSLVKECDPVLEVGCGHGRVTLPLLHSGRQVVGVDQDPSALDYLRERLRDLPDPIQTSIVLAEIDFLQFQTLESFGAVIIPCNTVSTFSRDGRTELFQKTYSILREGGLLAASLPNPLQMYTQLKELGEEGDLSELEMETIFHHPETGFPVQVSSRIAKVPGEPAALRWDWIYDLLSPDGRVERKTVATVHYPVLADTYREELSRAGFQSIEFLGDFDGSRYQEDSPYLIFTCRK
ncbi:MAG: class I SAM-dependent methyltransferase [Anaerolineales bacterium]